MFSTRALAENVGSKLQRGGRKLVRQKNSTYNLQRLLFYLGGAVVGRRIRDRKVAGSTPGQGAIKSTRSTQPSIPPG